MIAAPLPPSPPPLSPLLAHKGSRFGLTLKRRGCVGQLRQRSGVAVLVSKGVILPPVLAGQSRRPRVEQRWCGVRRSPGRPQRVLFGLAALAQGIVDVRMKLAGCYIYSFGLGDCWCSPVVHGNCELQFVDRRVHLAESAGPISAKVTAGMLKHVVRALEQAICVVDVRMGFGGRRLGGRRLGSLGLAACAAALPTTANTTPIVARSITTAGDDFFMGVLRDFLFTLRFQLAL